MLIQKSKNVLLGIGNPLRGDDGAGSFIANHFHHQGWISLDGKSAPENFTSIIRKIQPQLLVIIDSTQMNLRAGSIRIIPTHKIVSLQLSTHSLPLHLLMEYLAPYCQETLFIGIQPLSLQIGEHLSEPVLAASKVLIDLLAKNQLETIQTL